MATLYLLFYGYFVLLFVSICVYIESSFEDIYEQFIEYDKLLVKSSFSHARQHLIDILKFHIDTTKWTKLFQLENIDFDFLFDFQNFWFSVGVFSQRLCHNLHSKIRHVCTSSLLGSLEHSKFLKQWFIHWCHSRYLHADISLLFMLNFRFGRTKSIRCFGESTWNKMV